MQQSGRTLKACTIKTWYEKCPKTEQRWMKSCRKDIWLENESDLQTVTPILLLEN